MQAESDRCNYTNWVFHSVFAHLPVTYIAHSPGEYRANGPLQLLDSFHKAFDVKEGDPMFYPMDKRCEIW